MLTIEGASVKLLDGARPLQVAPPRVKHPAKLSDLDHSVMPDHVSGEAAGTCPSGRDTRVTLVGRDTCRPERVRFS